MLELCPFSDVWDPLFGPSGYYLTGVTLAIDNTDKDDEDDEDDEDGGDDKDDEDGDGDGDVW